MPKSLFHFCACLALFVGHGNAQSIVAATTNRLPPVPVAGVRPSTAPVREVAPVLPASELAPRFQGSLHRTPPHHTVLYTLGGAIVGAWVGYVASQVATSDWDKSSNGEFAAQRIGFAAGGALAGALGGRWIGRQAGTPLAPAIPTPSSRERSASDALSRADVERSGAANAFELVQLLRPAWLRVRGLNTLRESARGEGEGQSLRVQRGVGGLKVYLDNALLGGTETLRQVSAGVIGTVRYFDPAAATLRWGQGHAQGVILVSTATEEEQ